MSAADLASNGHILGAINWASLRLFSTRFQVSFQASFSYTSKCLYPLVLEQNTSISKGEFLRVFQKRFFEFFTTQSILFSHTNLSFPLLYQFYRDLCCERVLGDQVLRSPKYFIFVYEEANLRVRVVSSTCGSLV